MNQPTPREVELFDEWRDLFTKYRNAGKLSINDRKRFKWLSNLLSLWFKKMGKDNG